MKRVLFALPLLAIALCAAKVSRVSVVAMEESLDKQLSALFPEDPVMLVGVTHAAYITGYGVVFTGELNLAPSAGITPFHQTISKEEVARIHSKEVDRLPKLKLAMQQMLASSAASLDAVPADEQIAMAISLFHFHWENLTGVPSQIVMHAPRKTLLAVNAGRADRPVLSSAVTVEEF
ncbi:MAG: hypothetical protein ACR2NN_18825 [Bryobacteraceae bacterium]